MEVEIDIIASITGSSIGGLLIMNFKTFKTDVIVFIFNIVMCLMSH